MSHTTPTMADQQQHKIHPVDVEAPPIPPPSAPLVPRDMLRSDKGDPAANEQYPPYQRTMPVVYSPPPKKRRGCCCKCICWTLLILILLVVAVAATVGILYLVFDPKVPKYSVDKLRITDFTVNGMNASASFDVTVTANNPNKHIGIYYEDGSELSVWYSDTSLCSGRFPVFYQGHRNVTVTTVNLSGQTQLGSGLITTLQQQQQTGMVPIKFRGDVPVRVKFGGLKLWKVTSKVRCDLVVSSLIANNQISIKTSSCKFSLKL